MYLNSIRNILVCVTQQKTCERLIMEASNIKGNYGGELHVIHVAKNEWKFLDNVKEGEALEYLFRVSKSVGAKLSVLKSDDIVNTILEYINDNDINFIVVGKSKEMHKENNFIKTLENNITNVEICIV
ncbi:MAG TPA: universal stress protein [Pseudobacteroides sp.]|uniref:universal stress protein n=1 Tax=Pseudobacteroides sp. TaxID=1968840 RepID=UPI002F943164